mmetsp:Transcript_36040/g.55344  ORF Transcript_36040/g.55344 Transcript_36040/m.55344 type:complete len:94 (+) Transcript_36040:453-734(+)
MEAYDEASDHGIARHEKAITDLLREEEEKNGTRMARTFTKVARDRVQNLSFIEQNGDMNMSQRPSFLNPNQQIVEEESESFIPPETTYDQSSG